MEAGMNDSVHKTHVSLVSPLNVICTNSTKLELCGKSFLMKTPVQQPCYSVRCYGYLALEAFQQCLQFIRNKWNLELHHLHGVGV